MNRRCVPLRGDHHLLTSDTLSGVRLHPVLQVQSECVASCDSAVRSSSQRGHRDALSRRLRFEDETETEAETRYLERQRRRVGQAAASVLISKPDLHLYVNSWAGAGTRVAGHDRQPRGHTKAWGVDHCDSGIVSGGGVNLNLHPHPPEARGWSLYRPHLNLRTEPIRETYIGVVTPCEVSGGGGRFYVATNQLRRTTNQVTLPPATTDLPINPYSPKRPSGPVLLNSSSSSAMMSQSIRLNGTKSEKTPNQEQHLRPATTSSHRDLQSGAELKQRGPFVEEEGLDLRMKNSPSSPSSPSEKKAENKVPSTTDSRRHGIIQPMRAELCKDDTSLPEHLMKRKRFSHLSLGSLFSTVTLSRTRTGSLDRLSSRPRPSAPDPVSSGPRKTPGLLKKTLSVQSLSVQGSPFLQLRKSLSVQSFQSDPKKDRSADYRPATDRFLQRCLSLEDVGCPSSVRSVGRLLQVCPDGTFLLEVCGQKSRTYGFIISRGKGRPDSGVYVEDMVDDSTEKLYAGLLEVGDEILEVNGEKAAGLSLDRITNLLTQNDSVTIRVLRHQRTSPR